MKAKLEVAGGGYSKVRLPFPQPALERKAVKEQMVSSCTRMVSIRRE